MQTSLFDESPSRERARDEAPTRTRARVEAPTGRELAQEGAERAARHADKVYSEWQTRAYDLLQAFCADLRRSGKGQFITEDVRAWAERYGLPRPPDQRAWGAVVSRAARVGLIRKIGWTTCRNPHVHSSPTSLWAAV